MEQTRALQKLMDGADLLKMIEDIIEVGAIDRLSPASLSGMRLTLKNVREEILSSHDSLASEMISRNQAVSASVEVEATKSAQETNFTRRDLRASIDAVRE